MSSFPLLMTIHSPADLRALPEEHLPKLAEEIRNYLIQSLDHCGGHFAANLGTVELAIALHYVYDTPEDRLIWDVGHQAYPHKILTGRRDQLHTIKQPNGLSPFPKRSESEYDSFGVGHSSTSISAGLGMAVAAQLDHIDRKVVSIIGDGGLTGGMAFEALNHGGSIDPNLLVILNDNEMSISENVGALTHYLARILSGKIYSTIREGSKKVLAKMPPLSRFAKRTETHLKGMIAPGTIFEELGFNYLGPIDGHDLPTLIKTLQILKTLNGAKLLHVITVKGKGYAAAEQDPIEYHAVKPGFNTKVNVTQEKATATVAVKNPSYSEIFGEWLCDMAAQDSQLIGITPAMCEGSGMIRFAKEYADRYHDVGIAEQHSVTFAAGLACEGKKPVVAFYSTFLQRAYDQLIHDVALQNLDVTFAVDRAGLVGSDGPTHAGSFDLSFLRCIPNMIIMAPKDGNECWKMLSTAYQFQGPAAVRYPRGAGPLVNIEKDFATLPIGKAETLLQGKNIVICAFGSMVYPALQAGKALNATVINMRFIKPLDKKLLAEVAHSHSLLVTIEENAIMGGAGSAVTEFLHQQGLSIPVLQLGLPDYFIEHGNHEKMLAECGLDAQGIQQSILNFQAARCHASML
jgi:1-deoxy-D-xylulose-5-phosphate synthase